MFNFSFNEIVILFVSSFCFYYCDNNKFVSKPFGSYPVIKVIPLGAKDTSEGFHISYYISGRMARIPGLTVGDKDLPKILKIAHEGTKGPLVIHLVIKEKGMSISMLSNGLNRIKKALPSNVKTIIYVHIPDL